MKQFSTNWTVVYDGAPWYVPANGSEDRNAVLALYCLSGGVHTENNKCGLHFSTLIMVFVCVLRTPYYNRYTEPLATPGDAVMSFLRNPDVHTEGMSTKSKDEILHWGSRPKIWDPQRARWYRAASRRRWLVVLTIVCYFVMILQNLLNSLRCFSSLILVAGLLREAISEQKRDLAPIDLGALWREGLGAVTDHELVGHGQMRYHSTREFLSAVLMANAFQLLFNLSYFMYNSLLTCMSVS